MNLMYNNTITMNNMHFDEVYTMKKVFIDGGAGTTGLRIVERLSSRNDIEIIKLEESVRKDYKARKQALNSCDAAFLCLPDEAAVLAADMVENKDVILFDTSTAHRTQPGWAYGFPELGSTFFENIKTSKRIAVPGCHASGFIALVYPLIKNKIVSENANLTCHSITGYSGGGKKMIAQYEDENADALLGAPRQYAITQSHKHLKEMSYITGLETAPVFCPIVAPFYSGMVVTVPLFKSDLKDGFSVDSIKEIYKNTYNTGIVSYVSGSFEDGFISAAGLSGKDSMQIAVCGNEDRILLIARYDNLGKGASGAAIECMNIAFGLDPALGLDI